MASSSGTSAIERVQGRKNYHALADYLREKILSGSICEGEPLPTERELGGQAGLSRGSVREALRILEVEGLVSTRPGRNGGTTIRRPGRAGVSRSLTTFVRGERISFDAVLETREVLEPALAALAAMNRSATDLEKIAAAAAALVQAGIDNARFVAANTQWHWAVAQASHNPLLVAMVAAVGDVLHRSNIERFVSAAVRDAVIRAHATIAAAIVAGDAEAAYRRMLRHLRRYRAEVRPVAPGNIAVDDQRKRPS